MKKIILLSLFFIIINPAFAQNYDESKVPDYTIPEVLQTAANDIITKKTGMGKRAKT